MKFKNNVFDSEVLGDVATASKFGKNNSENNTEASVVGKMST